MYCIIIFIYTYFFVLGFLDAFTDGKTVVSKHGKKLAKVKLELVSLYYLVRFSGDQSCYFNLANVHCSLIALSNVQLL